MCCPPMMDLRTSTLEPGFVCIPLMTSCLFFVFFFDEFLWCVCVCVFCPPTAAMFYGIALIAQVLA